MFSTLTIGQVNGGKNSVNLAQVLLKLFAYFFYTWNEWERERKNVNPNCESISETVKFSHHHKRVKWTSSCASSFALHLTPLLLSNRSHYHDEGFFFLNFETPHEHQITKILVRNKSWETKKWRRIQFIPILEQNINAHTTKHTYKIHFWRKQNNRFFLHRFLCCLLQLPKMGLKKYNTTTTKQLRGSTTAAAQKKEMIVWRYNLYGIG